MRRMDYPIAKAKELNIFDEEWFERPSQNEVYLKKRLPNGVYRLRSSPEFSRDDNIIVNLFGYKPQTTWYKALMVIATSLYSIQDLSGADKGLDNGLIDCKPYFSIDGGSDSYQNGAQYLIVKDDIVFLTGNDQR